MIGSEAVASVKFRLMRGTAGSPALDSLILAEMRAAQKRLEQSATLPDFLITESSWQAVTKDEERVLVPTDFIREVETDEMQLEDTETGTKWPVTKEFYDDIRYHYGNTPGLPEVYTLSGRYFRMRPIPNKTTYRLWMTYYGKDVQIELADENKWLKNLPDLIMGEAGVVIATAMGNQQALSLFTNMLAETRSLSARDTIAREMANFDPNPED